MIDLFICEKVNFEKGEIDDKLLIVIFKKL